MLAQDASVPIKLPVRIKSKYQSAKTAVFGGFFVPGKVGLEHKFSRKKNAPGKNTGAFPQKGRKNKIWIGGFQFWSP
jgi:hypothetical protein